MTYILIKTNSRLFYSTKLISFNNQNVFGINKTCFLSKCIKCGVELCDRWSQKVLSLLTSFFYYAKLTKVIFSYFWNNGQFCSEKFCPFYLIEVYFPIYFVYHPKQKKIVSIISIVECCIWMWSIDKMFAGYQFVSCCLLGGLKIH